MKTIIIKTQSELDVIPKQFKEFTVIEVRSTEWISVEAWENSSVEAWENSSVEAMDNSSVVARDNSRVEAWENSRVVARDNSRVVARDNSRVEAWGNSRVVARGNSSVVARDNSRVEAWENVSVKASDDAVVSLLMFAVCWMLSNTVKIKRCAKTATVIKQPSRNTTKGWLEQMGLTPKCGKVAVFKRVSKDLKTQEETRNETTWAVGAALEVEDWNPGGSECGDGKFHGCAAPFFCNQFRDVDEDRYVEVEVDVVDLHAWPTPEYPTKIAFRKGTVLREVDRFGEEVKQQ